MGKKIRFKEETAAALYDAQMSVLRQKKSSKKQKKRQAPIFLPAICNIYPPLRPLADFKCSSCSGFRRSNQLVKYLYCRYAIPAWLIEWFVSEGVEELNSAAHERSIALLMSIISEMGWGCSPRNILKPYLSKTEMTLFFKIGKPGNLRNTIFGHFVYCKAMAKGLSEPVCVKLAQLSAEQRLDKKKIFQFVQCFIEFCATRDVNAIAAQDIWDFLRCNKLLANFSFKGRTLASMLNLVNAWHEALNREMRILQPYGSNDGWAYLQARIDDLKIEYKKARGIPSSWIATDPHTHAAVEVC